MVLPLDISQSHIPDYYLGNDTLNYLRNDNLESKRLPLSVIPERLYRGYGIAFWPYLKAIFPITDLGNDTLNYLRNDNLESKRLPLSVIPERLYRGYGVASRHISKPYSRLLTSGMTP
jgi:hypothetical protein